MKIQGKTALITGASRGIGREIALAMAKRNVKQLIVVARNSQGLADLAIDIGKSHPQVEVTPVVLDLTDRVAVNIAMAQAWRDRGPIDLLVNCAGVAYQSPFLASKFDCVRDEIGTNLLGMYAVTQPIARRMVSRGEGTIVNVASLMGKVAAPTMSTYSATKFAILGFTQALRGELATHNVRAIALLPSLTDTDMARDLDWFRWAIPMSPQYVAEVFVNGLERGTHEIIVGWQSHLAIWGYRVLPWLLEKVMELAAPISTVRRKPQWLRTPS
jgi:3-oxoacyl-[acyl-carrier protein] reductase